MEILTEAVTVSQWKDLRKSKQIIRSKSNCLLLFYCPAVQYDFMVSDAIEEGE